jgi:hypothetical protein
MQIIKQWNIIKYIYKIITSRVNCTRHYCYLQCQIKCHLQLILEYLSQIWEPLFNIQYRYAPLARVASRPCGSLSCLGPPEAPAHRAFARLPSAPVRPCSWAYLIAINLKLASYIVCNEKNWSISSVSLLGTVNGKSNEDDEYNSRG